MHLIQIDAMHSKGESTFNYRIDGKNIADSLRKAITKLCKEPSFIEMEDVWDIRIKPEEQPSLEEIEAIKRAREVKVEPKQSPLFEEFAYI